MRTTVEQNIVLRWVSEADLPALYARARSASASAQPGAETIVDITACPGTDTCKLGIASSRGLAGELRNAPRRASAVELDAAVQRPAHQDQRLLQLVRPAPHRRPRLLRRQPQHRRLPGAALPGRAGRQVGGQRRLLRPADRRGPVEEHPGGGRPPHRALRPRAPGRRNASRRSASASARRRCKQMFDEFTTVPAHGEDASYYSDWGDPREFTTGDMGTGECAGEVVSLIEFDLADAEREVFEAQFLLEEGDIRSRPIARLPRRCCMAAKALVKTQLTDVGDDPTQHRRGVPPPLRRSRTVRQGVRQRQVRALPVPPPRGEGRRAATAESAHQLIEEASLFVEAGHACQLRLAQLKAPAATARRVAAGGSWSRSPDGCPGRGAAEHRSQALRRRRRGGGGRASSFRSFTAGSSAARSPISC